MNGLLDFLKTPQGQGLIAGVAGYAAGARRGTPINNLGRGGLAGLAGYTSAIDRQTQDAQQAELNKEREQMRAVRDLQIQQARTQAERAQAEQAWRSGLPQAMQSAQTRYGAGDEGPTMTPGDPNALRQYLMRPESPFADEILKQQLFPKAADYKTVGNALVRVGPEGVSEAYRAPEKQEKTPIEKQMDAAGITDPATRQRIIAQSIQKSITHAPAPSAVVNMKQETEEAKAVGKMFGESFADIQKAGFSAQSKVNQYDRLGQLLEGVNTGKFTQTGLEIAKAANAVGLNIDPNLGNKEAAQALSGEIALALRNPSGGAGMPGAMSDADRQFLVNMVPGLATTPDGRKLMLDTAKKLAKRDMDVARIAREYRKKNGSIDEGFYDELNQFSQANPLFAQQPKATGGWSIRPKGQ